MADGNVSVVACNHARKLLEQSHSPGHTRVRDYDPTKLDAVFEAYVKCRQTYRRDPFVLFFSGHGMGFVAEIKGMYAYATADGLLDPAAAKVRAMPKASAFYALERRVAVAMLTIAVNAYKDAAGLYDGDDSRYWRIDSDLARASQRLTQAAALPRSLVGVQERPPSPQPTRPASSPAAPAPGATAQESPLTTALPSPRPTARWHEARIGANDNRGFGGRQFFSNIF